MILLLLEELDRTDFLQKQNTRNPGGEASPLLSIVDS